VAPPLPAPPGALPEIALRTRRKIARRILPFVFLLYIVAYLDRANVAYAGLPMRAELGFSEAVFGFGAGVFFLGYLLLEIPGALIVERWSARRWLARILVTWGLCTILVGLVRTPSEFYGARFLLGAAEAGFFPGIVVYLTHWFRAGDRARATAGFVIAAPVALAFGAPLAALILNMHALGLTGWRWVFFLEGIPAIVLGVVTLYYLTDHPRHARWLAPEERDWIAGALAAENQLKAGAGRLAWWQALRQPNVLLLTAAHFFANMAGYGFVLWLPNTLSKVLGFGPVAAALLSGLPFAAAIVAALLTGRSADRRGTPRRHATIALLCTAAFLALGTVPGQPLAVSVLWLTLTGAAAYSWVAPFWVLPTLTLTESAAAASIGLINCIGNLGGFAGPALVGYLLSRGWPNRAGMLVLAGAYALSALLTRRVQAGHIR
jgi:MFS transporter, ACS family, tartrate transporter